MSATELILPFSTTVRKMFIAEESSLISEWAEKYRFLFDELDVRTARNQAPLRRVKKSTSKRKWWGGYHFYEWQAAILIYEATEMRSLVEGYQGAEHARKQEVLGELFSSKVRDLILNRSDEFQAQAPDLLVYAEDYSSYFFCEVKGPGDKVSPKARAFFDAIQRATGHPVMIARLVPFEAFVSVRSREA